MYAAIWMYDCLLIQLSLSSYPGLSYLLSFVSLLHLQTKCRYELKLVFFGSYFLISWSLLQATGWEAQWAFQGALRLIHTSTLAAQDALDFGSIHLPKYFSFRKCKQYSGNRQQQKKIYKKSIKLRGIIEAIHATSLIGGLFLGLGRVQSSAEQCVTLVIMESWTFQHVMLRL